MRRIEALINFRLRLNAGILQSGQWPDCRGGLQKETLVIRLVRVAHGGM